MVDKISFDTEADEEYMPTDSEDNYSDGEREVLEQVKQLKTKKPTDEQRELLRFDDSSDDDDDDDDDELMRESDIEGAGDDDDADMPDSKDWGSKSRNYYHTDFVDKDYSSYNAQEEEMALQEEEEAKQIQLRLAKQMKDEDFLFDELCPSKESAAAAASDDDLSSAKDSTKIKADLSGLTKRERQQLFHKQSPEYAGLMVDMKHYLAETKQLLQPIMEFVREHSVPLIPGLQLASLYQDMLHTYCCNVAFYLVLKAKGAAVRNHPVIKRLVQLKKCIAQLQPKYEQTVRPQLETLLEAIQSGEEFSLLAPQVDLSKKTQKKKKAKLSILDQYEDGDVDDDRANEKSLPVGVDIDGESDDDSASDDDADLQNSDDDENALADEEDGDDRRGITYQMAKNKGLMPHRKKEQRNPRVKHRSKFRKALIRRKGAVRTVRTETKRYGGEISGIKAGVIKSVKFKS